MRKHYTVLCIFILFLLCVTHGRKRPRNKRRRYMSNEFDVLMFTQRWPPTVCFMWKENSESHSCSLPKSDDWTIHGIWPTQYHSFSPQYCNRSLPFNETALKPIESQLKEKWIDIQNGSKPYSFWKHEWNKHGTCALTIKNLDSEFKYFQMGLKLLDTYNMIDVLAKANILSGQKYMVENILGVIEKILGKRGQIMCVKNEKTDESYLFEIRICFDKTLQLMHCDGVSDFPTNCNRSGLITYPSIVPHNKYNVIQV